MEAQESKNILITWDFSNVAEYALQHAIRAAKTINANVVIVHIVEKEKEIESATEKMKIVISDTVAKYGFTPEFVVKEGTIFKTISETADEYKAIFVIMGTHGIKGMQKITGSWALRVIAGSKMPFIVVQKPPMDQQLTSITYPVDYKKEDKQKSVWAVYLNKYFKSKLYMFVQKSTDATLTKHIQANVIFTKNVFDNQGIEYEVVEAPGVIDFSEETVNYAKEINSDAILITTTKNIDIADYMFGATEQKIIANKEGVTVMCVNPKEGKITGFN
ncbi:MAG: universal stress protein [Bacteroidales bacterium]|nr:universal stress protein [Bacteroidales bacterium]